MAQWRPQEHPSERLPRVLPQRHWFRIAARTYRRR